MIDYEKIPKIELHCHLDGSVRIDTASDILNIDEKELEYLMVAKDKCNDLNDYLTKFDIPVEVMQTKYALEQVAYDLSIDMVNDGVVYAEIRFAPLKHLKDGLSVYDVMESVFRGLKRTDLMTNIILCMMRGDSLVDNMKVIDLAHHYLNNGVCAVDLAGAESIYKTEDYEELFNYAKEKNVPFTIHAGEADGVSSIKSAIAFGAKRIGHGIRIIEDDKLIEEVKEKDILLEICPTSNIQTRVVDNYKEHPIKKLYEIGVSISINTDNRTVSNTTLVKEYRLLHENLDFKEEDFIKINKMALEHAFLSNEEKSKIQNKLNSLL